MSMDDGIRRTAYGYTRVSTDEQVPGASLENQKSAIQKYADRNNIKIVGWYEDPGFSAKNARRPGLQEMLESIKQNKGKINFVVVYNISRISRNMESFFGEIGQRMAKYGTTLRSTQEVINETPFGKCMLHMALTFHQFDNDIKAMTVKDDMAFLASQGWWMSQAPIGLKMKPIFTGEYTKDGKKKYHNTLEIDNKNNVGENIRFLLNRFSEGDIIPADLVRLAHRVGVNGKNGKPITLNTMLGILKQTVYAGYNSSKKMLGGELTKIRDFDGLISLETFNKNQRILNGEKKTLVVNDNAIYPLRKLLICSDCEKRIRSSAPRGKSGKRYPRYHCTTRGHSSISTQEMHQLFVEYLEDITPNDGTVKLFKEIIKRTSVKMLGDTNKELAKCREKVSEIDKKFVDATDAFLKGEMDLDEKNRYIDDLESQRSDLNSMIDELERTQNLSESTIEYVCNFITKPAKLWMDADLEARQAFQNMMFPNGLHFNIRERKFGTQDLSPLFSVICNKNESDMDSDSGMVISAGVEPALTG